MRAVKDLVYGSAPAVIDVLYNGDLATDSTTKRYKGSLVKLMDYDDIDHGTFFTFAGLTTGLENLAGILEEEQGTSDNYLPDDATYGVRYKKMTAVLPSTIIEAEYSQADAAGTANTASGVTGSASGTSITATITTADTLIGGWLYFLTGSCAGYLYYITDNGTTTITVSALAAAVASGDTFLVIQPPNCRKVDFDATYSGIKSQFDDNSNADPIVGLNTLIQSPGIGKTKLDREKHNGLKIANARFFHEFCLSGNSTYNNVWVAGIKTS